MTVQHAKTSENVDNYSDEHGEVPPGSESVVCFIMLSRMVFTASILFMCDCVVHHCQEPCLTDSPSLPVTTF